MTISYDSAINACKAADISVTLTSARSGFRGREFVETFAVTNDGGGTATQVIGGVVIDRGARITSVDGGLLVSPRLMVISFPSLSGGATRFVQITMTLTGRRGTNVRITGAAYSLVQADPTPVDNVSVAEVAIN